MPTGYRRAAAAAALVGVVVAAQPAALGAIHLYRATLSPIATRAGIRCRFEPTCSRYAEIAISRDGIVKGGWRAVKRIARCTPLTPAGTHDEP